MPELQKTDDAQNALPNNRRNSRQILDSEVLVRQSDSQPFRATLSDLSVSGFKLTSYTDLDPKKPVYIRLPGIQTLSAATKWCGYQEYGCAFTNDLHPAVLEHLVKKLQGF